MTNFLIRHFVKDADDTKSETVRGQYGRLSSFVGIGCNVALFFCKFLIGTISGSVSITADSVNNLSDAGSSVVTLIGFKVSGKPADEGHPFGHARAEYIGGLAVAFMILMLGVEFLRSSAAQLVRPEPVEISLAALAALALSILVKLWMCAFNRTVGRKIDSAALLATAQDSLNDAISTSVVVIAAAVAKLTSWQLDGAMGVLVALFILYSGLKIANETVSPLLGQSPPPDLVDAIEGRVRAHREVLGVHDLMVHSYGPQNWFASLHAEVDAREDILRSHDLIDNIEREVLEEMGVHLVIHLDPIVLDDPEINDLRDFVSGCVRQLDKTFTMHDFRLVRGKTHSNLIFDVSIPAGCKLQDKEIRDRLQKSIGKREPDYYTVVTIDRSYISTNGKRPQLG